MEKMKFIISLPLLSFLLLCLVSISHSQVVEDQSKTCPVKFGSMGTCSGSFGISECYHEAMARYGNIPPKGCQCIPNGPDSRFCRCNVACHKTSNGCAPSTA